MMSKIIIFVMICICCTNSTQLKKAHDLLLTRIDGMDTNDRIMSCVINMIANFNGFNDTQEMTNITNNHILNFRHYVNNISYKCHMDKFKSKKFDIYNKYLSMLNTHLNLYRTKYEKNPAEHLIEIFYRLDQMIIKIREIETMEFIF